MKKILLSVFALAVMGIAAKVQAQCTVSNLVVQPLSFNAATCEVTFNVQFDQEINAGNKFAYIHLWQTPAYHTPAPNWVGMYSNPNSAPHLADLVNAIATVSIQFNGTLTPSIMTTYLPDPGTPTLSAGLSIVKTLLPDGITERQTISGFSLTLPSCAGVLSLKGDIWAAQAANGKTVHCATQGLTFNLNNPAIVGAQKICNPRQINFGIQNNGSVAIDVEYKIYRDQPTLGLFDPGATDGASLKTATLLAIAPGATVGVSLSSADLAMLGLPGENGDYWIQAKVVGDVFATAVLVKNNSVGCAPLPVSFTSFTAARNGSNVLLRWQTSTERNSAGFAVERNVSGTWQEVGYVPTQAIAGNSDALLTYTFVDMNNIKGITQYRIRQVDIDNRSKFSEIRSVRGEGQDVKTTVYPNPTNDGKVNIAFDDSKVVRNVSVMDMSGRTVRQINGITNNNITIENLMPGIYTIRVVVPETGDQGVQKIIVNKR